MAFARTLLRFRNHYAMTAAECAETLIATRGKPLSERAALMEELSPSISLALPSGESATGGGGTVREFSMQHTDEAGEATRVAVALAATWPRGATKGGDGRLDDRQRGLVVNVSCDPALPLVTAGGALVTEVLARLRSEGCDELSGIARLDGLCEWVVAEESWKKLLEGGGNHGEGGSVNGFHEEMAEAVEAVAKGVPRKGHSVLGQGTFAAARPAWEELALEFARSHQDADSEATCLRDFVAGAQLAGVNWMHDSSPEAIKAAGGCTAAFAFAPPPEGDSQ